MQPGEKDKPKSSFLNEEQKMELRRNWTYTQRFDMLMKLIRIDKMLKNAKIIPPQTKN